MGWMSVGGALLLLAALLAALALHHRKETRHLRAAPEVPTGRAATVAGEVFVRGRIVPDSLLEAPMSGRRCLAFDYEVHALVGEGKKKKRVQVQSVRRQVDTFVVDDGSGPVTVRFGGRGEHDEKSHTYDPAKAGAKSVQFGRLAVPTGHAGCGHVATERWVPVGNRTLVFARVQPGGALGEHGPLIVTERRRREVVAGADTSAHVFRGMALVCGLYGIALGARGFVPLGMLPVLTGTGLLLLSILFIAVGRQSGHEAREMDDTPTMPTGRAGAAAGHVFVSGHVGSEGLATAPLSGQKCLGWDYEVEAEVGSGEEEHAVQVARASQAVASFTIDDGSGPVTVRFGGRGEHDEQTTSYTGVEHGGQVTVGKHSIATTHRHCRHRAKETVFAIRDPVLVYAQAGADRTLGGEGELVVTGRTRDALVRAQRGSAASFTKGGVVFGLAAVVLCTLGAWPHHESHSAFAPAAVDPCKTGNRSACEAEAERVAGRHEKQAFPLYLRACDLGDAEGCYHAGFDYLEGEVVANDQARAHSSFERACAGGSANGCNALGLAYQASTEPADHQRACAAFTKACDAGDGFGCANLADCYRYGAGEPLDGAKAAALEKQACADGDTDACHPR